MTPAYYVVRLGCRICKLVKQQKNTVCTVFNEHKACLMRLGANGPAIQEAVREQCGMYAVDTHGDCP